MLRKYLHLILFFVASVFSFAQNKTIALEEIWDGTFSTDNMEVLHSMNNGQQYSVLNFNRATRSTSIDVYDYETQSKTSTLVDSKDLEDIPYFTNYTLKHKVYYHKLGTSQKKDLLVFGGTKAEKHRYIGARVTEDNNYLLISASISTSCDVSVLKI